MSDTKISALPAASTPLTGSEVVPLNQSGVTSNVTVANLTAGRNITFNNTLPGYTTTATAAGTTTLTSNSTYHQRFTGSSVQTVVLPAATTMAQGQGFVIDNDSSGTLALQDGSAASLGSVTPGMAAYIFCENNSTTAGSWSGYMFVPGAGPGGQITWGTSGLSMGGQTITNATWNGVTITVPYGGTGLTSLTANYIPYGNGTGAFSSSANFLYDGTNLNIGGGTAKQKITVASGNGYFSNGGNVGGAGGYVAFAANGTNDPMGYIGGSLANTYSTQDQGSVVIYTRPVLANTLTNLTLAASFQSNQTLYLPSLGTGLVYSNAGVLTSTNPSDENLKTNVITLPYGLNEILQLKPVAYNLINDSVNQGTQFGFIAQDVQKVVPAFVKEGTHMDLENKETTYLGLDREGINAAMCIAIQELSAQIKALQAKVGI